MIAAVMLLPSAMYSHVKWTIWNGNTQNV